MACLRIIKRRISVLLPFVFIKHICYNAPYICLVIIIQQTNVLVHKVPEIPYKVASYLTNLIQAYKLPSSSLGSGRSRPKYSPALRNAELKNGQELNVLEGKIQRKITWHKKNKISELQRTELFLRTCQSINYSRISQNIMEPENSLPFSQAPSIDLCPRLDQSIPNRPILSL
jgi:hypothetical protein